MENECSSMRRLIAVADTLTIIPEVGFTGAKEEGRVAWQRVPRASVAGA